MPREDLIRLVEAAGIDVADKSLAILDELLAMPREERLRLTGVADAGDDTA